MTAILYVFYKFFSIVFDVVMLAMIVRAVTSWFPNINRNSAFMRIIYAVTEFFISPVRTLLWKIPFIRTFPLDLSFLATYILLSMVQSLVYMAWAAMA